MIVPKTIKPTPKISSNSTLYTRSSSSPVASDVPHTPAPLILFNNDNMGILRWKFNEYFILRNKPAREMSAPDAAKILSNASRSSRNNERSNMITHSAKDLLLLNRTNVIGRESSCISSMRLKIVMSPLLKLGFVYYPSPPPTPAKTSASPPPAFPPPPGPQRSACWRRS